MFNKSFFRNFAVFILPAALLLSGCESLDSLNKTDQLPEQIATSLISASEDALYSVAEDQQIGAEFLESFHQTDVVGVIINPNLVKGGIFFGGSGGAGILLARAENGEWSYPTFIRQGAGSFGIQLGFQSSKVVSLITSKEQLQVMLDGSPIAGGEAGGSVASEGAGVGVSGGLDISSALRSFAVSKGAFVGADVKLGGLWVDTALNKAFYGAVDPTPSDIVLLAQYQNAKADALRNQLSRYSIAR